MTFCTQTIPWCNMLINVMTTYVPHFYLCSNNENELDLSHVNYHFFIYAHILLFTLKSLPANRNFHFWSWLTLHFSWTNDIREYIWSSSIFFFYLKHICAASLYHSCNFGYNTLLVEKLICIKKVTKLPYSFGNS